MNSFNGDNYPTPPVAVFPPNDGNYGEPYPPHPNGHGRPSRAVNEREFQQLYNKVNYDNGCFRRECIYLFILPFFHLFVEAPEIRFSK